MRACLALALLLAACAADPSAPIEPGLDRFPTSRTYLRALFESDAACAAAQAEGVNCHQQVDFCADGSAWVMWTDIVGSGEYAIDGGVIATTWSGSDGPASVTFELAGDLETVRDGWLGGTFVFAPDAPGLGCE